MFLKSRHRNDLHAKKVDGWLKANEGLSQAETTRLLVSGIEAIRRKSLSTLSGVTMTAVIDRILHETKEKLPILTPIMNDSDGLHFLLLLEQCEKPGQNQHNVDVQSALREFLLEFLDVVGKITAEILTRYLHQELIMVTRESFTADDKSSASRRMSLAKKNREQK